MARDLLGRLEDRPDRQVGVGGERRAEPVGLVGHLDVEGVAVGIGVDGDGGDAHLPTRPHDANGDLAAVRDEELRVVSSVLVTRVSFSLPASSTIPLARSPTC